MSRTWISIATLLVLLFFGVILSPVAASVTTPSVPARTAVFQEQPETPPGEEIVGNSFLDGVGVIFAVLGVYIVTMFTMAIGTEILVDILKGIVGKPLGLKSKPNARDKLLEYERFLPGALDDLGVSAAARLRLEKQLEDVKNVLKPAFTAETAVAHLRHKQFTEALATLGVDWAGDDLLQQAKGIVQQQVDTAVANIDTTTTLGQTIKRLLRKAEVQEKIDRELDRLARRLDRHVTPEAAYQAMTTLLSEEIADAITMWTAAYLQGFQDDTYETALSKYENQLLPQIVAFNLPPHLQKKIEIQFETFLENLRTYHRTDIYLESLNNFLVDLEVQRNIVRSSVARMVDNFIEWCKRLLRQSPSVQHPRLKPSNYDPRIGDSTQAVSKLMALNAYDEDQDKSRLRRIRFLSFLLGTGLAYLLQVDSADLLRELFPENATFLFLTLIPQESFLVSWIGSVLRMPVHDFTAGVLLTGLAASAGSSFWHDQLARLRAVKEGVQQAQEAIQPLIIQATRPDD